MNNEIGNFDESFFNLKITIKNKTILAFTENKSDCVLHPSGLMFRIYQKKENLLIGGILLTLN